MSNPPTKKCAKCKKDKELTGFSKNKSRKDGYQAYCKECQAIKLSNRQNKQMSICLLDNEEYQEVLKRLEKVERVLHKVYSRLEKVRVLQKSTILYEKWEDTKENKSQ